MYAKVYNLKFLNPTDAKIASSYFAEQLSKFIRICNMQSINVSLGACGSMSITAKFETSSDLKTFESKSKAAFEDISKSFNYKVNNYSGVYVYTYEAESSSTEIALH
jgi:hypothetical protein|tara:strand:+ start:70 stop:390 length:321 start_codon:yes stop_codon:yes gene_type:complete